MTQLPQPIAILAGGPSNEAAVSRRTAAAVAKALDAMGIANTVVELELGWKTAIANLQPAFVFIALHGCPGEDGVVQSELEAMGLPYQGSGVVASALAMDKPQAKAAFAAAGLDVALGRTFTAATAPALASSLDLPLPVVAKPAAGGSSLGVTIVHCEADWPAARDLACKEAPDGRIEVEEFIPGRELTVAVVEGRALGVMEICPVAEAFYDYEAKYTAGASSHVFPAHIPPALAERICKMAVTAHDALSCRGVTRTDFRYDEATDRLVVLEVNTLPGLTEVSLMPEMAAANGISFNDLVVMMIKEGLQKCQNTAA